MRMRERDINSRENASILVQAPWVGFIYVEEVTVTNQER